MSRPPRFRVLLSTIVLATLFGGPQLVAADGVDQAQNKVDRMLNELQDLEDRMGQLDEDYGTAQERQTQLQGDIATSQVKLGELNVKLGSVQSVMAKIALDRYTAGDTLQLSPIFSDAETFTRAEQKAALGMVAIDAGQTSADGLQALADAVAREQSSMQRMQGEAVGLIKTLEDKQAEYSTLEKEYTAKYAQAKRDLGEAKFKAALEQRAATAAAKRAKAAKAARATGTPRGGGSAPRSSPSVTINYPAPSGKAGIAIRAALSQLGVPYRFATAEPGVSFDCSGLTAWAWGQAGVSLPRVSRSQFAVLPHVPASEAQPGDLIFYYTPIGHVGLYLGSGQMVHAPQTGTTVSITVVHWNKVVGVGRPG